MAIVGLTDKQSDYQILGKPKVKVFKGSKKTSKRKGDKEVYYFGSDLGKLLRISTEDPIAANFIRKYYGNNPHQGDFLVEAINIYLAFDEPDRTFATIMRAFDASGLKQECNRQTINQKVVSRQDGKGNKYRQLQECNEQCPVFGKSMAEKCPHECQKEGTLYFYIREMLDANIMIPCALTTHSFEDLVGITGYLTQIYQKFGALGRSPFFCQKFKHKIPFILYRSQVSIKRPVIDKDTSLRTEKKAEGKTWALTLQIHPDFLDLYDKWQAIEGMKQMQVAIAPRTVAGLLAGDSAIEVEAEVVPGIRYLSPQPDHEQVREIQNRVMTIAGQYHQLTKKFLEIPDLRGRSVVELLEVEKQIKGVFDDFVKRVRDRISMLSDQYFEQTGKSYDLPSLDEKTASELVDIGKKLAQEIC
jgi:hypothetical protein